MRWPLRLLLVAAARSVIALPDIGLPPLTLPGITTSTESLPSSSTTDVEILNLPTSTTSSTNGGHFGPNIAHTEKTVASLDQPTFTTSTTSQAESTFVADTAATSTSQVAMLPQIAHVESSATAIQTPVTTVNSPTPVSAPQVMTTNGALPAITTGALPPLYTTAGAATTTNSAPIQAYDSIQSSSEVVVYTSNNAIYSKTIPAPTQAPVLYTPASGAVGLVAGSSAVIIAGTTYSLQAGGSAIWVNGVSASLKPTEVASWSTSHDVVFSNGITVSASDTAFKAASDATTMKTTLKTTLKTTMLSASHSAATSNTIVSAGASGTSSLGSVATGAASILAIDGWTSLSIALSMVVAFI